MFQILIATKDLLNSQVVYLNPFAKYSSEMSRKMRNCPLNISDDACNIITRSGSVRDFPEVGVLECISCGVTFHEENLEHIVDYPRGTMNLNLIEEAEKTFQPNEDDSRRGSYIRGNFPPKKNGVTKILDFGSGYGNLIGELKSDYEILGVEIDVSARKFCESQGFEMYESLDKAEATNKKFDIITMIHVIEHLCDPVSILKRLATLLSDGGRIIIETPNSDDALLIFYNCEPFQNWTYWSHHPILFNSKGLANVLKKANMHFVSTESVQRYNLANHLYWLSNGKPGGHDVWRDLATDEMNSEYRKVLFSRNQNDTLFVQVSN